MTEPAPVRESPLKQATNVPNLLTIGRLALSIVLFWLLAREQFPAALAVFVVAAGTDWVDGYWARKYGQVTKLGRVLDPFADKLIVCGAFVFLAGGPQLVVTGERASGVAPWMAVVVMARELAVTGMRSFVEAHGGDFSAKWAGKWKMLLQCAAITASLVRLAFFDSETRTWDNAPPGLFKLLEWGLPALLWAAMALTIYSGLAYAAAAFRRWRSVD
jgi:CDP-diacylglycerol--glycerol-3-phosphate 3-phosphatidyltransferase